MSDFSKRDWKVFQEKLPGWQEAYMDRLCKEYAELLNGDAKGSEKFWTIEKRIKEDRKRPGVRGCMNKSDMEYIVLGLLRDGAITMEDLEDFTEDFKARIKLILGRNIF